MPRRLLVAALAASAALVAAPTAQAAPACTKAAAKRAVVTTPFAQRIKRGLGRSFLGGGTVMRTFVVGRVLCEDVTGDDAAEMVVHLQCCTVSSPSPWAIFVAEGGRWRLAFSRVKVLVFRLDTGSFSPFADGTSKLAVEEKIPDYGPNDANCCPSSFEYEYTVWDGQRFMHGVD